MLENLNEEIVNLIEEEGRDLKYKLRDKLYPINFDCTPSISYDFLLLEPQNEYSFSNSEMNVVSSEELPNLSDAQIYFQRIKEICNKCFYDLEEEYYFKIISPNKKIKDIVQFIFSEKLHAEQIPLFIEIKLYTNKNNKKAPRVFGFIGNASMIYILFYDPFHQIFNKEK